jgi:hypothetical protein
MEMLGKCQIAIGQAGVYRVLSELILRGYLPYTPVADDHGVDILLPSGVRIQVKTARLHERNNASGKRTRYFLSLGWTQKGANHRPIKRQRKYSDECDYFVIFGVEENRFWIVPSFVMDGLCCLELGARPRVTSEQVQSLLDSGKGVIETAKDLGVSRGTVWYRKHGDLKRGGWARAVRQCEDRWEFLDKPPADLVEDRDEVKQLESLLRK